MKTHRALVIVLTAAIILPGSAAFAQASEPGPATDPHPKDGEDMTELANKLNNPVASLISAPFQSNFDFGGGPEDDGFQYRLNIQPVIPINLNEDWKVISRTILPFIHQDHRTGTGSQTGLGDTTASFFFSPRQEHPGGWIWGAGPLLYLPTATDDLLGTEKWGAGPTALALQQRHGWTYGVLASHIWSFAGEGGRDDVSLTSIQPFLNYTMKSHTTLALNTESTYDWEARDWTVPINLMVSQLVKIGKMPVNFQVGGRYYADKPDGGPDWGVRFTVTLVLPE